jgi:ionotropic glutamate receptor
VTEGEKMKAIEKAWLGIKTNCPDSNTQVSSNSLSLTSFWGLFLIAGVASLLAIIISIGMFLYKQRQEILRRFFENISLRRRIWHTLNIFDERDFSSHNFIRRDLEHKSGINSIRGIGTSEPLPNTNFPPTPSIHSRLVLGDSRTPSREYADSSPKVQVSQPPSQVSKPSETIELIGHPNQEESRILEIVYESI